MFPVFRMGPAASGRGLFDIDRAIRDPRTARCESVRL